VCLCHKHLENDVNEDVRTQIRIFSEHKEEDAEEFSHRYDNIRFEMEYPLTQLFFPPNNFWGGIDWFRL